MIFQVKKVCKWSSPKTHLKGSYGSLVSCQGSNNGQPGVSFAESLRYKKPYVAMAMRVFCALTFHKIYDRLTHHLSLDATLALLCQI